MSSKFYAKAYDILAPMATFLHPIAVEGLENVPKDEPVVLCPNHSSNWDPILLICALGREVNLRIMGKNQLFKIPILRSFLRKMGVFPVDRGHSDIGAVKNCHSDPERRGDADGVSRGDTGTGKEECRSPQGRHRYDCHSVRGQAAAGVYRREKAALCQGAYYFRQALCPGVYREKRHGGGIPGQRGRGNAPGLCPGRCAMQVMVAESAGFCYGVKRAVDMARETARKNAGTA